MTDRLECKRLVLQIERDLVAQVNLRMLLNAAGATLSRRRQELRIVRERMKRHSQPTTATKAGRSR